MLTLRNRKWDAITISYFAVIFLTTFVISSVCNLIWGSIAVVTVASSLVGSYIITIWSRYKAQETILGVVKWRNLVSLNKKIFNAPTSHCFSCKHNLEVKDVTPIVSFIRYKGRCPYCGVRIGWTTLLLEVGGAIIGLSIFLAIMLG